ncbi:MAG: S8 family peptidase, partial [candidate division Zixibacteria bacterium]
DGDPSTTDDVPDVINNSWGVPLGYYSACNQTFWEAIDNLEAVGVVCVFAAGNEGPYVASIRTPADRIATEFNSFCVGAVNGNYPDLPIASFSSRGPSGCDSITVKPEVSAPGVSIRSTSKTGGYISMSGTSMATPHVAGAAAILRQFNPNATPSQIKQALMYSALDLGSSGEDNDYGWGVINIRRALNYMPPPMGIYPAFIDTEISGDGIADPGEEFGLGLLIENLGRPAENLTAQLTAIDPRVTVISGNSVIEFFDHNDTVMVGQFTVYFAPDISQSERISFVLTVLHDGESSAIEFDIIAGGANEPGIATHDNDDIKFSFSNIGQFGLGTGSVNPLGGEGFKYPSDGLDFLKSGTLMLAVDPYHVSDGAITSNPALTDDDFMPAEGGFPRIVEPGIYSDQDGFSVYSDSTAENPLGMIVTQRSFCWTGYNSAPFVITEFTIENISGGDIDSIYVGIFCDWDLPLSSGNDDIVDYIDYQSLGYIMDLSTGVSVGVKAITHHPYSYAAIDNSVSFGDGFSEAEKFGFMTSRFENVSYSAPGNYSHLITVGPFVIQAGESEVAAFSFVAGSDLSELITNAELSLALYPGRTDIADTDNPLPSEYDLITNYPNPFNGSTIIELAGEGESGQVLSIYDIAGRLVKTIPVSGLKQVTWDGSDDQGNDLAAGIYFARLSSSGKSSVRKMVYLK